VDRRRRGERVVEDDADTLALLETDLRTGDAPVAWADDIEPVDRIPTRHTFPASYAPAASGVARAPAIEASRKRRRSIIQ
jgi:hypothetical protein